MIVDDHRAWPERALAFLDERPDSMPARLLAGPAALYAAGSRLARALAPERPLPTTVPSLGVGNLRVGGSGKTPVVEDLGRRLVAEGHRVAVLTRGYRAAGGGDEPAWLEGAGLAVFADPDRRSGFARAVEAGATRILLDDALQTRHRPRWTIAIVLDRDLARHPRPLPAGPAREGPEGLDRATLCFVRREAAGDVDVGAHLGFRLAPDRIVDADRAPVDLPGGPGMLLSGLARPESFEADARSLGLDVAVSWRESDHWTPAAEASVTISRRARQVGARWILVPEKNLERARRLRLELPLRVLVSRIRWDAELDPLGWLRERGVNI